MLSGWVKLALELYELLIFVRILMSWLRPDPYHPVVRVIYQLTEPVLEPARRMIPPLGMFDISPIIVIFVLQLGGRILLSVLYSLGL